MKLIPEPDFPELKRDPKSGIWYVVKEAKGKKSLFRSTRERKSKTKATKIGRMILAEYLCLSASEVKVEFLFDDIAAKVLELKKNKSPRTIRSCRDHIELHLMPFFRGYKLTSIDETVWEEYIVSNPDRKLFNDVKQMRTIMKYAFERGLTKRKIKIRNPDEASEAGKAYKDDQIERLLKHANEDLKLQIKLGFIQGMRKEEILLLPWWFFEWEQRIIAIPKWYTKTRKSRRIPIHSSLYETLWIRFLDSSSPFVFPSPDDINAPIRSNKSAWQNCKKDAKVRGRFHDLRHTFMSMMIHRFGVSIQNAAKIAGMSLQVADQIYCHPTDEDLHKSINSIRGIPGSSFDNCNENAILQ